MKGTRASCSPAKLFRTIATAFALLFAAPSFAYQPTPQEWALLPSAYCRYTNSSAEAIARPEIYNALIRRYGQGWSHIHHYCRGLVWYMRYFKYGQSNEQRVHIAKSAIQELDYVIRNSPSNFPLLPMVLLKKAEMLDRFGQQKDAITFTRQIVAAFPAEPEGYARLAFYLRKAGEDTEAANVLEAARKKVEDKEGLDAAIKRYEAMQ